MSVHNALNGDHFFLIFRYDIMLSCWRMLPESRPLFATLESMIYEMLGEDITDQFMNPNESYLRSNKRNSNAKQADYSALMGTPDFIAPSINDH